MLAKMEKLTEGKPKNKTRSKDDDELMLGDDSEDELNDNDKL
jgi:Ca2+-binding EF-hand superfamily protein